MMTEKKEPPTTFKLGGKGLEMALELRHVEEVKTKRVVTIAAIVRRALSNEYARVMAEKEGVEE
jgi:hypothetical protein